MNQVAVQQIMTKASESLISGAFSDPFPSGGNRFVSATVMFLIVYIFCTGTYNRIKLKTKRNHQMKYCENCGTALEEGQKFCTECGRKIPSLAEQTDPAPIDPYAEAEYVIEEDDGTEPAVQETPVSPPETKPVSPEKPQPEKTAEQTVKEPIRPQTREMAPEPKKKVSGLSIAAFICSLLVIAAPVGIILAIVDLVKRRNQQGKKGLSVAALIIGGIVMILSIIGNTVSSCKPVSSGEDFPAVNIVPPEELKPVELPAIGDMTPAEPAAEETDGIYVYSPKEEVDFAVTLNVPGWSATYTAEQGGYYFTRTDESEPSCVILLMSVPASDLSIQQLNDTQILYAFMEDEGVSADHISVQGIPVNGGYNAVYSDCPVDGAFLQAAVWKAGERVYVLARKDLEGRAGEGEEVFYGILDSFRLASEADPKAVASYRKTYVLNDYQVTITTPGWECHIDEDDLYCVPKDEQKDIFFINLLRSSLNELPEDMRTPEKAVEHYMMLVYGYSAESGNPAKLYPLTVNGGYQGVYSEVIKGDAIGRFASWQAGDAMYLIWLSGTTDYEPVYQDIINSFKLIKP